jgi:hypothetical protein
MFVLQGKTICLEYLGGPNLNTPIIRMPGSLENMVVLNPTLMSYSAVGQDGVKVGQCTKTKPPKASALWGINADTSSETYSLSPLGYSGKCLQMLPTAARNNKIFSIGNCDPANKKQRFSALMPFAVDAREVSKKATELAAAEKLKVEAAETANVGAAEKPLGGTSSKPYRSSNDVGHAPARPRVDVTSKTSKPYRSSKDLGHATAKPRVEVHSNSERPHRSKVVSPG